MIPDGDLERNTDFVVSKREQITETTPADPANSHRLWTGPEDANAKVRLRRTGKKIQLWIEVEDDVDHCPKRDSFLNNGDQVRLWFFSKEAGMLKEFALVAPSAESAQIVSVSDGKSVSGTQLSRKRNGIKTVYDVLLPLSALEITTEQLDKGGLRFEIAAADDDGEGIDTWLHIGNDLPEKEKMQKANWIFFHNTKDNVK